MPIVPTLLQDQLSNAKALHGAGRLAEAERLYGALLASDKDNAEVATLLAAVALQRGDSKQAKKLWKRILSNAPQAWLFLGTLYNLLQVLQKEGATAEARRIAGLYKIPDWPAVRKPDDGERDMLLALSNLLVLFGQPGPARNLLASIVPSRPRDAKLLFALGQLQMHQGDLDQAWQTLTAADAAIQPDMSFSLLTLRYQCAMTRGDLESGRHISHRVIAASPIFMFPPRPTQRAHVLILNGSPNFMYGIDSERRLHFHINYPSQLPRALADELHFSAVFSCDPAGRAAAERLPKPDLIINNYCNGELLLAEGHLAQVSEFADSFGVPVVNHPSKVPASTRDRSAELVADLPGLVVPRTRRFSKAGRPLDELAEEIEATSAYPLITRNLSSQQGVGMTLVENRPALIDALTAKTEDDFFVIPFIDSRGPTGYFRKIRAAIIDGEIFIIRVDYDSDWNVHGRKSEERVAFYLKNPELLAEEDRICKDPDGALGETAMAALHAIAERIPLDIFGVDFDVANDGRLVFYEANATMNFLSTARPEVDHPRQAEEHMVAAIRHYLFGLIR